MSFIAASLFLGNNSIKHTSISGRGIYLKSKGALIMQAFFKKKKKFPKDWDASQQIKPSLALGTDGVFLNAGLSEAWKGGGEAIPPLFNLNGALSVQRMGRKILAVFSPHIGFG